MEKINFVNNSQPYINADNLNGMQNNVENAIADAAENTKQEILNAEVYSTNEVKTNKIWRDGSDIYSKTIHVSALDCTTAGFKYIAHGISNLKSVITCEYREQGEETGISSSYSNEVFNNVISAISFNNTNIRIYTNAWGVVNDWDFMLEYTKTTD